MKNEIFKPPIIPQENNPENSSSTEFNPLTKNRDVEKPKNNLHELIERFRTTDILAWGQLIEIRDFYENEWREANKARIGTYTTFTEPQKQERERYVSHIDLPRVRGDVNARIKHCDDDIGNPSLEQSEKDTMRRYKKALEKIRMRLS